MTPKCLNLQNAENTKNGYQNEALGQLSNNIPMLAKIGGSVLRKPHKMSSGNQTKAKNITPNV